MSYHLYAKELVLRNFVGLPAKQLLERLVELSLRAEQHLQITQLSTPAKVELRAVAVRAASARFKPLS